MLIKLMAVMIFQSYDKICDQSIVKPLSIIYQNCLNTGTFPDIWKKSNIVPAHKKGDKLSITIDQYLFCVYVEKSWKD